MVVSDIHDADSYYPQGKVNYETRHIKDTLAI